MSNTTYTAITIGPIYKTLLQAKRTREVWQSSYFFSYIMKQIHVIAKTKGTIILPAESSEEKFYGAGIFPDRLIITSNETYDVEQAIIQPAIKNVAKEIKINEDLLYQYLNIHFVQVAQNDLEKFELKDDKGNTITSFIHKLNYLLDVKELNQNYTSSDTKFYDDFFDDKTRNALYSQAFSKGKKHKFNSVLEITAQGNEKIESKIQDEIKNDENKDIDDVLLNEVSLETELSKPQKYLAILRADGDNFGKVISSISEDESKVTQFSQDLVKFSEEASNIINTYGGTIIYIGGDDILAFCPLQNNGENIFELIQKLNGKFNNIFIDKIYKDNEVSLSYGLSISYYKYPLNEALDNSFKLLFEKAKKEPLKNCIAFQVLQHSGSIRETILNFSANYDSFTEMLGSLKEKEQLLQSLTHQLIEDQTLLIECLKSNDRIDGYFENHYNPETKNEKVKDFIEAMKKNLKANYSILQETNKKLEAEKKEFRKDIEMEALKQMNTVAKTINFLN